MGFFSKVKKAFKKVINVSTGGLIGGYSSRDSVETAAPELGFVDAEDTESTTEAESEKQQLTKGKKRGKKALKIDMAGAGGTGRNIV